MINLAIEQLHADRHAELLRQRRNALEARRAVLDALRVWKAIPIARKHDHIGQARRRDDRQPQHAQELSGNPDAASGLLGRAGLRRAPAL